MRFLKKLFRKWATKLPPSVRLKITRSQIRLTLTPPENVIFKLADTEEELVAALRLLHDGYVRQGFMSPHPSGLRATVYHALPTTSTLIAKKGDQVIATVSIVRNNPLGIPLEKIFSLENIKKKTAQFAEISSLCVHPDFRGHQGLFFLLTKYMMEYSLNYYHVDYWTCAVNPKDLAIYRDIFLFEKLAPTTKAYDFVNGAPAIGFYTDLADLKLRFYQTYSKGPVRQDLYSYYFDPALTLPSFKFPRRMFHKAMDPVLTASTFENIFIKRVGLLETLGDDELELLRTAYSSSPHFLDLIPMPKNKRIKETRRGNARFKVRCEGYLQTLNLSTSFPVVVVDVNGSGFMAELPKDENILTGQSFMAKIELGPRTVEDLFVKLLWVSDNRQAGFEIINSSTSWGLMISQLMEDFNDKTSDRDRRKTG